MVPGLIQSWAAIRSVIASDEPYTTTGEPLPHLPDLLKDDKGGQAVRKRLAEVDVEPFSGFSGTRFSIMTINLTYPRLCEPN